MKILKVVLSIMFAVFMTAALGMASGGRSFRASLTGKQVVPAVATKAHGTAYFKLSKDGKELTYTLKVRRLQNITAAHIHAGRKGKNGGPVAGLFAGPKKEGAFTGVLAKGTITDKDLVGDLAGKTVKDLVKLIRKGGAYVNVHTDAYPDGELRGQIK